MAPICCMSFMLSVVPQCSATFPSSTRMMSVQSNFGHAARPHAARPLSRAVGAARSAEKDCEEEVWNG